MSSSNITRIQLLIDEIDNFDFNRKSELDSFFIKIQNEIVGIFGKDHYYSINLVKDAKVGFVPTHSVSLKDFRVSERENWNKGKQNLKTSLETVLSSLQTQLNQESSMNFIDSSLIEKLRNTRTSNFDSQKLIRYFEEINFNYRAGNYLTCAILARAVLNYIPPIFGQSNFRNIVSNHAVNPYTRKNDNLDTLEQGLRKIGDLHNHDMIKKTESIPTKNQIEPYKPQFEYLTNEIISNIT